jgi:predicted O-linked N-acetylglucosamine transferase (SPINDLY family)/glycosyltransferase involved in cell wall biosynthesis
MRLIIEGWRFLPHSYGVIAQFLGLELCRRGEVELFHRDIPFFDPSVRAAADSLGDESVASRLAHLRAAQPDQNADATLRVFVPLNFEPAASKRTLVFATAEFGALDPAQIGKSSIVALNADAGIALVTPSEWSRSGLIRSGADPDKVVVIPHGVDPEIFHPVDSARREELRRGLGWHDRFIFLNVGALTGNKGIVDLLKAFAALAEEFPAARLVLKGLDGIYKSNLSLDFCLCALSPSDRDKIEPRLTYIGKSLTFKQTAALYQAADVYVTPYHAEAFNLPVLEAAACGLPVICTGGGPTDEFTDTSFALRIASRVARAKVAGIPGASELAPDLEDLTRQLRRTLTDRDWVENSKSAGPEFVLRQFTWRHAADRLLALLSDPYATAWRARSSPPLFPSQPNLSVDISKLSDRATKAYQAGDRGAAYNACREILRLQPLHADTIYLLGAFALDDGRSEESLLYFHQAATLRPGSAVFQNALGEAYQALGKLTEAQGCFASALAAQPEYERAHLNIGLLMHARGDFAGAEARFAEALRLNPNYATAHNNLGGALQARERIDEAISHFRRALELRPAYPEAHFNLGAALHAQGDLTAAAVSLQAAVRLRPSYARAHAMLGQCLVDAGQVAASIPFFQTAIKLNPDDAVAPVRLADVLRLLGRFEEAMAVLDAALRRRPRDPQCLAHRFRLKSEMCDWSNWYDEAEDLWTVTAAELLAGRPSPVHPMFTMSLPWSSARQTAVARSHARAFNRFGANAPAASPDTIHRGGRIRVGHLSRDFYDHPVAHQIHAMFAHHDRGQFEIHVYSFGPDDSSTYRQRIARDCEKFHDVSGLPLQDLNQRIRDDGVHILVDLMGYSGMARTACLASRPAPIQVSWLGYPGTMGADFIDYIVGDRCVTPAGQEAAFSEKIVRLPHSYMVTDGEQPIDAAQVTRRDHALPEQGVVFCCFNNAHKIDPGIFDIWMRILSQVPGSVAWLSVRESIAQGNLRTRAQARGINADRLVFAAHVKSKAAHLKRLGLSDLFLDTHYYNAHATGCDALWAGVPLLTCPADTFASRVASSLLTAVGLPELIVPDLASYEQTAIRLAQGPQNLRALRERLAALRLNSPLFDTGRFVRGLERAFVLMWDIYKSGQAPRAIDLDDPDC